MSRSSLTAIFLLALAPHSATAQTTEQRDYQVLVNGREAGTTRIVISEDKAGVTTTKVEASVKFTVLFVPHTFATKTTETWEQGRLVSLDADSTENGVRTLVSIRSQKNTLNVLVNGVSRKVLDDAWTSSFWKLADKKYHNAKVPILEPDSGNDMLGDLKFVGNDRIVAAGKAIPCFKFRIEGIPTPTDLWYDEHHRLVRQEFTERGQRMVMQMVSRK
jgi:hypothetical protein